MSCLALKRDLMQHGVSVFKYSWNPSGSNLGRDWKGSCIGNVNLLGHIQVPKSRDALSLYVSGTDWRGFLNERQPSILEKAPRFWGKTNM